MRAGLQAEVAAYLKKHPHAASREVRAAVRAKAAAVEACMRELRGGAPPAPQPRVREDATTLRQLLRAVRSGPRTLTEIANALDLSPRATTALIKRAHAEGYDVHVVADVVGQRAPTVDTIVEVAQPIDDWQVVGVISDLHAGSKYCMREQLRDFVQHAYDCGVRTILSPGDLIDGCYRHGRWELTHHGLDAQCDNLFTLLPALPGLEYHAIEGNHDDTFRDASGVDVSRYIEARARTCGRDDIHMHGGRQAMLRVQGALVTLWHPGGSAAYAKSYRAQKFVEGNYGPHKPDVVLIGHFHQFNYCDVRGVHAICCPTFQGAGSRFSKMLGGSIAQGGLILSWRLTPGGTLRDFNLTRRAYYEVESPTAVHSVNTPIGEPIERAFFEQGAVPA